MTIENVSPKKQWTKINNYYYINNNFHKWKKYLLGSKVIKSTNNLRKIHLFKISLILQHPLLILIIFRYYTLLSIKLPFLTNPKGNFQLRKPALKGLFHIKNILILTSETYLHWSYMRQTLKYLSTHFLFW